MARDLAIDLGTANTLVYARGEGLVFAEPSVIALNKRNGEVLAMGNEAWKMIGRTPGHIVAERPLRKGAIKDFDITQRMVRVLFERVGVKLIDPGCGACIGAGPGVSTSPDQVSVSAINRNFQGRSGPGKLYLASPLTVAASAFTGIITSWQESLFG